MCNEFGVIDRCAMKKHLWCALCPKYGDVGKPLRTTVCSISHNNNIKQQHLRSTATTSTINTNDRKYQQQQTTTKKQQKNNIIPQTTWWLAFVNQSESSIWLALLIQSKRSLTYCRVTNSISHSQCDFNNTTPPASSSFPSQHFLGWAYLKIWIN